MQPIDLQMVLSLECLRTDRTRVLSLVAVNQFMLGQGTRIVKCLATYRTLDDGSRSSGRPGRLGWSALTAVPRLSTLARRRGAPRSMKLGTVRIVAAYACNTIISLLE